MEHDIKYIHWVHKLQAFRKPMCAFVPSILVTQVHYRWQKIPSIVWLTRFWENQTQDKRTDCATRKPSKTQVHHQSRVMIPAQITYLYCPISEQRRRVLANVVAGTCSTRCGRGRARRDALAPVPSCRGCGVTLDNVVVVRLVPESEVEK